MEEWKEWWVTEGPAVKKAMKNVLDWFVQDDEYWSSRLPLTQAILNADWAGAFDGEIAKLNESTARGMETFRATISLATSLINGDWDRANESLKTIAANALTSMTGTTVEELALQIEQFGLWETKTVESVTAWYTKTEADILAWGLSTGEAINTWISDTITNIGVWAADFDTNITMAVDGVIAWFGEQALAWFDAGVAMIQGLIDGAVSMGSTLWDSVTGLAETALSTIKGVLGIRSPSTVMKTMGENMIVGLQEGIDAIPQSVLDEKWYSIGDSISKNFLAGFTANVSGIRAAADRVVNLLVSKLTSGIKRVRNAGAAIGRAIIEGINSGSGGAGGIGQNIVNEMASVLEASSGRFYGIGRNMIDSITAGIWSNSSSVGNALSWIIDAAIAKILADLGIYSPSKVMMEIGNNMIAGLEKGLMDSTSNLLRTTQNQVIPRAVQAAASVPTQAREPIQRSFSVNIGPNYISSGIDFDTFKGDVTRIIRREMAGA